MNVIRNETLPRSLKRRFDARRRPEPSVAASRYNVEFAATLGPRTNRRPAGSNGGKLFDRPSRGRGRRAVASASSLLLASSSNARSQPSRSRTRTSTAAGCSSGPESVAGGTVLAITTGRGDARAEVGIAALDVRTSHLILCQISDSQTYRNTLSKLYLFDPIEVLMPDTMCERGNGKAVLCATITDEFPDIAVTAVSRAHFNDTAGFERIRSLCVPAYSSVELFVRQKYYALAAAAALLKYVEYAQRVLYTPKSLKIEFQGSPNATTIDLESARCLELVQSQCGQRNISLLGILDHCSTPMGRKLMRANILQPPCKEEAILERQTAVAELVTDRSLRALVQPAVRRLHGADRLLGLSTSPVLQENSVQCAEHNLSHVLLLKNLLDVVPELGRILAAGKCDLFRRIQKNLANDEFRLMRDRILETIHPDARSVSGYSSSNMQRCFAIRAGINDLLDVARQTYCELIDDMKTMVENLAAKYKLPLSLSCNPSLGYHVQATLPRHASPETYQLPAEFTEVRRNRRAYTMTTGSLATLSQQCKIACEELHLMSNVLLCDLLQCIRDRIGSLFQLSADVAELDLVISLAEVSSLQAFARPTFDASRLEVLDSRHPVMEVFGHDSPVPNHVIASMPRNLCIISGPNMSGKSTYLKQIVLLHIMAQMGCFVPARSATLRVTDLMFCKMAVRDDIECNASTFALEMKEMQYILRSVTPTSLIVLDELCKGTATVEGTSIAWAVCEKLLTASAFTFVATHFSYLTKLANVYCNVTNRHFEATNARANETDDRAHRLTYTHRLRPGVASNGDDYGIDLAELSGLPSSITEKARKYARERVVVADRVTSKCDTREKRCYDVAVELYELLETGDYDRGQINLGVECLVERWRETAKDGEDDSRAEKSENENEKEKRSRQDADASTNVQRETAISGDDSGWKRATILSGQSSRVDHGATGVRRRVEWSNVADSFVLSRGSTNSSPFCSAATDNESVSSRAVAFRSATDRSFTCSLVGEPVPAPVRSARESPTTAMEKSLQKLYEYYLSDDDFEPLCVTPRSGISDMISPDASD